MKTPTLPPKQIYWWQHFRGTLQFWRNKCRYLYNCWSRWTTFYPRTTIERHGFTEACVRFMTVADIFLQSVGTCTLILLEVSKETVVHWPSRVNSTFQRLANILLVSHFCCCSFSGFIFSFERMFWSKKKYVFLHWILLGIYFIF